MEEIYAAAPEILELIDASVYVDLTNGQRKRIHLYGASRQEVHDKLADTMMLARKGVRTPVTSWTVGAYLDYWLQTVVAIKNRPRTAELYEGTVRLYLKPELGPIPLGKLTVGDVQRMLNNQHETGLSVRTLHRSRAVLRAALSRAEREELVLRNVAKLVDIPAYHRKTITPWTPEESATFLAAARNHRWYGAYLMVLSYGMRRGEVLGLRWRDVDLAHGVFRVEQQLQRVGGELKTGEVKTEAGRRILPLFAAAQDCLEDLYAERYGADPLPAPPADDDGTCDLVFRSSSGTPTDPKNFVRTFHEISDEAGLPHIKLHHTRHTAATTLKNLGVPARDAQLILGHAHVTTTQQLYQHGDITGQTRALDQVGELLTGAVAVKTAAKFELSTGESTNIRALTPGGPGGDRTLDNLLKSLLCEVSTGSPTPVIRRLRTRAYAHILGRVAVKYCCQNPGPDSLLTEQVVILRALRRAESALLRDRSFPLSLLPPATGPPSAATPTTPGHRSTQEGRAA